MTMFVDAACFRAAPTAVFTAYLSNSGSLPLRIGAYGLEYDGGDHFMGVWVYATEDGGSLLLQSHWGSDGTHAVWLHMDEAPETYPAFHKVVAELDGNVMSFFRRTDVSVEEARESWMRQVLDRVGRGGKLMTPYAVDDPRILS
jgi:hypothetical protein